MRKFIFILLCSLVTGILFSQTTSVKGTVIDSIDHANLQNTVISVLNKTDSLLVKFTRVEKNGTFIIAGMNPGKYIFMATHPFFGDYLDTFTIKKNEETDLGRIFMTPKSKLLAEVIVKSGSPIRIKGDTTVYTADSFMVRPGANVEELLRRLPGIQVGRNGEITAMGERVKKVLVDGEEFFGTDPGIATKNLRADVVKEVEVFDKKSDQAEFTGIDDGVKDKTINLKIKEDKKNGYFGKIEAGGGKSDNSKAPTQLNDFRFNNSAMLNAFKGKRKISTYGIMSNTGQTNLDWQDAQNYGGGSDNMMMSFSEDGGMMMNVTRGDEFSNGQGGIPTNYNWGLHYNNKFNNNKQSVNSGYRFSKIDAPGETKTFSNTFLPDTSWNTNTTSINKNSSIKHAFNLTLDYTLDSMNSLKWTTNANNNTGKTENVFYTESIDQQSLFINNSKRITTNNTDNNSVNSSLLWRHKFKKPSRTLSLNNDFRWSNTKNNGYLYSLNNYYSKGIITNRDTTDQQNIRQGDNTGITSKLVYTEPLSKEIFLELNYSLSYNHNDNERITNKKSPAGKYEVPIDSLSNAFIFNTLVNTPGLTVRWNKKKYSLTLGASAGISNFTQKNITENVTTKYNYINFFPRFRYNYKIKQSKNLSFNYNGSTTAPSLEQLQPTRVNTDPFNVYVGNPNLKQSFQHSMNAGYNSFNFLKEKNIFSNLSFNFTQNAFVQFSLIDSVGKRTYKTVNTNGVYNLNFFSDYGFKVKGTKLRLGAGPTASINRNIEYINGVKNITNSSNFGVRLNVSENIPDKIDFFFSPSFTWNRSIASLNSAANADYWAIDGWSQVRVTLPKKFELSTDVNFQIRQKDPRFTQNTNFAKWNASVSKLFLKDALEFKFGVYDILDQNRGYQRNFNSSSFTESYYLTLRRYWMATITWNISKNGKPTKGFMF